MCDCGAPVANTFWLIVALLLASIAGRGSVDPSVEEYYTSLESRLGYWLLLGNSRHCGLWETGTLWPFPMSPAQRRMEEKLYSRLDLKPGSTVLDAGTGSGYVAMYMANKGLNVQGIDLTPLHVEDAQRNIKTNGLEDKISVRLGDYHNLTDSPGGYFPDNSFDGIYTMETLVHADDPIKVLSNFYQLLRPDGVLVLHEADWSFSSEILEDILRLSHCPSTLEQGTLSDMLQKVGFENVELEELTDQVLPLWRFLAVLGYIPYQVFGLLGVRDRFINVMAAVEIYLSYRQGRYISVRAVKP